MASYVQGALVAATTACLYRQITQARKKQPAWENITLAANHLFQVVNALISENHVKSPAFKLCGRTVFYLTPIALACSFYNKDRKITRRERSISTNFSRFYYCITAASLAFIGNKEFRIAAFSVLALDSVVHLKHFPKIIREVCTIFCQLAAIATFIHYWKELTTPERLATMTVIGFAVFVPKIWSILPEPDLSDSDEGEIRGKVKRTSAQKEFMRGPGYPCQHPHGCHPTVIYVGDSSASSRASQGKGSSFNMNSFFLPNHIED